MRQSAAVIPGVGANATRVTTGGGGAALLVVGAFLARSAMVRAHCGSFVRATASRNVLIAHMLSKAIGMDFRCTAAKMA